MEVDGLYRLYRGVGQPYPCRFTATMTVLAYNSRVINHSYNPEVSSKRQLA